MNEGVIRDEIVKWGRSFFQRGLTGGSSGNISVRLEDGYLFTPTNSCLGFLEAERLSKVDASGKHVSGAPPTKELPLHFGFYDRRPNARAVIHLHSTYATAVSCLADTDPMDAIPPLTPYVVMRVGRVPVIPYSRPGAESVRDRIQALAGGHPAILLANHGPVVAGASLEAAAFAIEELEEGAKLSVILRGMTARHLTAENIAELNTHFRLT
ncbi:3-oxo-tetronate 4-phosphate decarboxylase [Nitratireductor kimnyeongensis]|uniref:3-oxo-tetronate 4-phosphate decarboxylase n=1 Tax=Nitratireductor kimnyeongensis TaxID=430679 RepID=A0ABW0TBY9_9HYPH|nr:3-oxo-tetronate 4-phosphate decarboxylase [Nitratireductor kimnyeongensis]QZZ36971.1 aldolase [Nitratireductor kimnyeongensis]